jgi:hypothetical protein
VRSITSRSSNNFSFLVRLSSPLYDRLGAEVLNEVTTGDGGTIGVDFCRGGEHKSITSKSSKMLNAAFRDVVNEFCGLKLATFGVRHDGNTFLEFKEVGSGRGVWEVTGSGAAAFPGLF